MASAFPQLPDQPTAPLFPPPVSDQECGGYSLRGQRWPLTRVYAGMTLGEAIECGRAASSPLHGPATPNLTAGDAVQAAWLDTETTGLAGGTGTYVFLIGIATVEDGSLCLAQYFLRDLRGERDMLVAACEHLRRCGLLVTFNGLRFDLPLLETRCLLSRLPPRFHTAAHLDLLNLARALWYRRLGGYSLALLERAVLGVERDEDVPGWLIPSLYVEYLRSRNPAPLEPVFAHNAADLLSMLALNGVAGDVLTRGLQSRVTVDLLGLGRLLEARDEVDTAVDCYLRLLETERDDGARWRTLLRLSRYYRGGLNNDSLAALWEAEVERDILPRWKVLERLAMVCEWQLLDIRRALALTTQALELLDTLAPSVRLRLERRKARLDVKARASLGRSPGPGILWRPVPDRRQASQWRPAPDRRQASQWRPAPDRRQANWRMRDNRTAAVDTLAPENDQSARPGSNVARVSDGGASLSPSDATLARARPARPTL